MSTKLNLEDYYSPEFATERTKLWPNRLLGNAGVADQSDFTTPMYEDFRKGTHMVGGLDQSSIDASYFGLYTTPTASNVDYNYRNLGLIDNYFQGRLGDNNSLANYQITSVHRLQRLSPIKPDNASHGVS